MRTFHTRLLLCVLLLCLGSVADAGATALPQALERKTSFDFVSAPLPRVVQFIARRIEHRVVVDPAVPADATVTLRVAEMPTHDALRWICWVSGLRWHAKDETLFITSPDKPGYGATLPHRGYDLAPLTAAGMPADAVRNITEHFAGRDRYARTSLDGRGRLAVTAQEETHRALGRMLPGLAQIPADGKGNWPCPSPRDPYSLHFIADAERWPERIRTALDRKLSFSFVSAPFLDVLAFIIGVTDINVIVHPALLAEGMPAISLRVKDMAATSALKWLVKLVDFRLLATESAVLITGAKHVKRVRHRDQPWSLCVYDVSAILNRRWTMEAIVIRLREDRNGHPRFARACGAKKVALILPAKERADVDRTIEAALRGAIPPPPSEDDGF